MDEQEPYAGGPEPISPGNLLDNALAVFNVLPREDKDKMIEKYEGNKEDFPTA